MPEHVLAKSWPLAVPILQSLEQGFKLPDSAESTKLYYHPENERLILFTWCSHTRLPCLPDILWSWLAVLHILEEDTQLLWFRSEDLPAVWWLLFPTKSSGDSKCGCKFGCNFFTESCWESWEWAPLWPLTGWPLYKVRTILVFSKGFLEWALQVGCTWATKP